MFLVNIIPLIIRIQSIKILIFSQKSNFLTQLGAFHFFALRVVSPLGVRGKELEKRNNEMYLPNPLRSELTMQMLLRFKIAICI